MKKILLSVTVAIAALAVSAERPAFAQFGWSGGAQPPQRSGPPPRGGPSRPSPPPSPTLPAPPVVPPFRSTLIYRPPAREHRLFPVRLPWFGLVAFDSVWWDQRGFGETWPSPVAPGEDDGRPMGGLQLDVEPRRALVYVDGRYVGIVGAFSGYYQHLELAAGSHLIELLAQDYEPLSAEVVVTPGRTTTFRGSLSRR